MRLIERSDLKLEAPSMIPPPECLWVDLRFNKFDSALREVLARFCSVHSISDATRISQVIKKVRPQFICFDFDFPDLLRFKIMQRTKSEHPGLPMLMLTEYHSEALAIWALRARVWDYIAKPVSVEEFSSRIADIVRLVRSRGGDGKRVNFMPVPPIPMEVRFYVHSKAKRSAPALSFVETNYPEKIKLGDVARLCDMCRFQFSRTFKRENGMTFQEFLLQYRIKKALELLGNPQTSVTEVAFAVGFNDLSYFSRTFRRYAGAAPSRFLRNVKIKRANAAAISLPPAK